MTANVAFGNGWRDHWDFLPQMYANDRKCCLRQWLARPLGFFTANVAFGNGWRDHWDFERKCTQINAYVAFGNRWRDHWDFLPQINANERKCCLRQRLARLLVF